MRTLLRFHCPFLVLLVFVVVLIALFMTTLRVAYFTQRKGEKVYSTSLSLVYFNFNFYQLFSFHVKLASLKANLRVTFPFS